MSYSAMAWMCVAISVLLRLMPHPHNMAPIVAIGLFCGATLPKRWAVWTALAAMALSDAILGWLPVHLFGWAAVALSSCIGFSLRSNRGYARIAGASWIGSTLFFLISNFGVWALGCGPGWYPPTPGGLATCYVVGLPFYRNAVIGDWLYSFVLFGGFELFLQWKLHRSAIPVSLRPR